MKNSPKKFYGRDRFQLSSTVGEGAVARTTKAVHRLKSSHGILVEGRLSALTVEEGGGTDKCRVPNAWVARDAAAGRQGRQQ
jgi:hypothetical protein